MAGFTGGERSVWIHELDNGTWVTATFDANRIVLNVHPPVELLADHSRQRDAAALMFKVDAFLAEDSNGEIVQEASVGQCLVERGKSAILIASYPSRPLRFENVCPGFREVFLQHPPDHDDPAQEEE